MYSGFCYITVTGPSAGDEDPIPAHLVPLMTNVGSETKQQCFHVRQVFSSSTRSSTSSARPQHGMVTHMVTIGKRGSVGQAVSLKGLMRVEHSIYAHVPLG